MTGLLLVLAVAAVLISSALAGPRLLHRAAPALSNAPRFALMALPGALVLWTLSLLALGPMLAWVIAGPALLGGTAGQICQRCVDAANPFAGQPLDIGVPSLALIGPAVFLAMAAAVRTVLHIVGRWRASRQALRRVRAGTRPAQLDRMPVLVADTSAPLAMALPGRCGGVVVSTATLNQLEGDEVAAVLAHERAHLRQHHHGIAAIVSGIARSLQWVPMVRAIEASLPLYLEIAADRAAVRAAGVPALASALLKLGSAPEVAPEGVVLHAAGPERIGQLVAPRSPRPGYGAALTLFSALTVLGLSSTVAAMLYLAAVATGCL